jgi:phosphoglucosamine mutase
MGKYFGTDGFRGAAGVDLSAEHAFKIGRYLGHYLRNSIASDSKPRVVVGKDPRLSSYMLEYAMSAGLGASGADVYLLHVTTTPCVSYVTVADGFDCGVMITASHNPYYDNGIKIIDSHGEKLGDDTAALIEAYIDGTTAEIPLASGNRIGKIHDYYQGRNRYVGYLISLASCSYKGLKIGIDAANGSAFAISRSVFSALGAEIHMIGDEPNGTNVNDGCGSTHPARLAALVRERGLDVGFAFDGDGDRCIAVDKHGGVIDGDRIMYVLALRLKRLGMLAKDTVVATVMSNGGFINSAKDIGITVEQTQVGDRFVYEKMQECGASLGGEESGHIIIKKYATTGDGILSAIMLTEEMCDTNLNLSDLSKAMIVYPQHTRSIRVRDKTRAISDPEILSLADSIRGELAGHGRLILRESGTEPKIRIMLEAETDEICKKYINVIVALLAERGHTDD